MAPCPTNCLGQVAFNSTTKLGPVSHSITQCLGILSPTVVVQLAPCQKDYLEPVANRLEPATPRPIHFLGQVAYGLWSNKPYGSSGTQSKKLLGNRVRSVQPSRGHTTFSYFRKVISFREQKYSYPRIP